MTIYERALELIPDGSLVGLGSGRASTALVKLLGARVQQQRISVRSVPTSESTAALARQFGIPILTLEEAGSLDVTLDGADEVDPNLDMIKGYGRALVREKIVAASSRRLVILVDETKLVSKLGHKHKLPVEVVPFGMALCQRRLEALGCRPVLYLVDGRPFLSDNGNYILDCAVEPINNPKELDCAILEIPGVVGTGLFLGMAETVLVGDRTNSKLIEERHREFEGNR